jgi:multicomponent Na+:H+ antiporter subunit B
VRRKLIGIMMLIIFFLIISIDITPLSFAQDVYHYYITNCIVDTGSVNCVTGIYLNYRIFDTIFETLLLLVSVIGIIYFSRHEGDY